MTPVTALQRHIQASAAGPVAVSPPDPPLQIGPPTFEKERGTWVYPVQSDYLAGRTEVEVLLPQGFDHARRYRVLYVLPVEADRHARFGDPMREVIQLGAAAKYDLLCVTPRFDTMPWYGAHATDPRIRHEEHFKKVVVPLIESRYPVVGGAEGRLLLGFSKSGFGAYSLILRDPDFFGYAASWDAPLLFGPANYGAYETAAHFGSRDNFQRYLPLDLLAHSAQSFAEKPQLVLAGSSLFGAHPEGLFQSTPHTFAFHQRLKELGVPHVYLRDLSGDHHWHSGWMESVLEALLSLADERDPAPAQNRPSVTPWYSGFEVGSRNPT